MENTPYLYDTLVQVLRQHRNWLDLRHLKTHTLTTRYHAAYAAHSCNAHSQRTRPESSGTAPAWCCHRPPSTPHHRGPGLSPACLWRLQPGALSGWVRRAACQAASRAPAPLAGRGG